MLAPGVEVVEGHVGRGQWRGGLVAVECALGSAGAARRRKCSGGVHGRQDTAPLDDGRGRA